MKIQRSQVLLVLCIICLLCDISQSKKSQNRHSSTKFRNSIRQKTQKNNKKQSKKSEGVEVLSNHQEHQDLANLKKEDQNLKQSVQNNNNKQIESKQTESKDIKDEQRLSKKSVKSVPVNNEARAPLTPTRPVVINKPSSNQTQLVVTPIPYTPNFVNASRPLPQRNTPIPTGWEDSTIVKQISTYSKKYLRDLHDPKNKNKFLQVGKPMYIEEGITFDEQPSLLQESAPHMTGVSVVQREATTQEKANLWRKFNQEEFKGHYKEVNFNSQDPHSRNYNSGIDDVIVQQPVRIALSNKRTTMLPSSDPILQDTLNPIKKVVYTKDKVDDITFDHHVYQATNRDLKKVNQMNTQGDEIRRLQNRFIHPQQNTRPPLN